MGDPTDMTAATVQQATGNSAGRLRQWQWLPLQPGRTALSLGLEQVSSLLDSVGRVGSDGLAEQLLRLLAPHVPLAQCTIFSFQGTASPRIIGMAGKARTRELPAISQDYTERFYLLDDSQQIIKSELARKSSQPEAQPRVWLHRQGPDDVQHADYRYVCYELPRIAERLSLLSMQDHGRWLSVNLYRGLEHGPFGAPHIAQVEAFAVLIMQAMRLHYAGQTLQDDLGELVLARLARRFETLTARDLDVVRALVQGLDTEALAQRLGISLSSARTYIKRVCAKLGVQGQRELFALLIEPA